MSKIDAKALYLQIKKGDRKYSEEIHCPMILQVMDNEGTMTAFCRKALISRTAFYNWCKKHKVFKNCYEVGQIISKANWEEEGETGKSEEFFNFDYWRTTGAMRYGVGKNRLRMGIDPKANPYQQYQQLVEMANCEEFNASEIKQLMESIGQGIRAFEAFKLQGQVDKMAEDVSRMVTRNGNNLNPIEKDSKTD